MVAWSVTVAFAVLVGVTADQTTLQVDTKQGTVEGALSANGLYFEFLGIRYAVPIRFRAPEEPPSFSGVYKADSREVLCPQFPAPDPLASPSDNEDCLVLNIYLPSHLTNATLPVMVFLHGGGFGVGSGSPTFYGPQYLVSHGVVLVTVNYRLNAYGFLNLGIKEAPGNAGLKDIRAALRWIRENIANFAGDPGNVTVFGEGSGGLAAIYLTMSESTKGLFHRVISESGAPFAPQSFDTNPLKTAIKIGKTLGVNTRDPYDLYELFSEAEVARVEEAVGKQMNAQSVFVPSLEETFDDEEPFLLDTPFKYLTSGGIINPVPMMIGLNTVEGLTSMLDYNTISSQLDRIKNEDYSALDQRSLTLTPKDREEVRNILMETYFVNATSDETVLGGIINLNTDFCYVGPLSLFTHLYSNVTGLPVFAYIFDYLGNRNLGKILTNSSMEATSNRDELFYLFELERLPLPMDEDDARMITFMTMMWTNFAKYGSPTPDSRNGEWLPYPHHLAIDLEPQYVAELTPERAYFWRSIYYKYGADVPRK
ncbi:unnamed protein product, partial [Iphiclides podalirius]